VALSFPYLIIQGQALPANNDIETWLPQASTVRTVYERFKRDFGVEELILIGLDTRSVPPGLIESLCRRLDRVPGIRCTWSTARFKSRMKQFGVSEEEALERLKGLAVSHDGRLTAVVAVLSEEGIRNRNSVVKDIREELEYCQLRGRDVALAGAPVVVAELDRLGGVEEGQKFFVITLLLCLGLLYFWLRDWKLSIAVMLITIWSINLTLTIFGWFGGQMNFILGALSVMVMVFTIEAAIHVLHYYREVIDSHDPVGEAMLLSLKPCMMSIFTTAIGLFSVSCSDIAPVTQFGYASGLGAVVAMLAGLGLTPAVLSVLRPTELPEDAEGSAAFDRLGQWITRNAWPVVGVASLLLIVAGSGMFRLHSKLDPLDFLPHNGVVYADAVRVDRELTTLESIEAVVDFGDEDIPFVQKLEKVRQVEARLRSHPAVRHVMSVGSFFPSEMPQGFELTRLLASAESKSADQGEFIAEGQRLWRISVRYGVTEGKSTIQVFNELQALVQDSSVQLTGIAPLLQQAQEEIFSGFWESFLSALGVIVIVMMLALRSVKTTILAMIPNLVPIAVVFGVIGWIGQPVDIGMMMTGSIVLGITVDGTFHFLTRYQDELKRTCTVADAVRVALNKTGGPIFESIVVSSIGMLALTLSSFAPTVRFGVLMTVLLLSALLGGLVLLPALLVLSGRRLARNRVDHEANAGGGPASNVRRWWTAGERRVA
jgi:predicted RND superfamily exporter protein